MFNAYPAHRLMQRLIIQKRCSSSLQKNSIRPCISFAVLTSASKSSSRTSSPIDRPGGAITRYLYIRKDKRLVTISVNVSDSGTCGQGGARVAPTSG